LRCTITHVCGHIERHTHYRTLLHDGTIKALQASVCSECARRAIVIRQAEQPLAESDERRVVATSTEA
jgi:hypothetical protein